LLNIIRRWLRIRRARREIAKLVSSKLPTVRVLSTPGATFTNLQRIHFVIATDTEDETDLLLKDYPGLYSQLCEAMIRVGYPPDAVPFLRFPVISQQTIDRDFGGSWSEAVSGR